MYRQLDESQIIRTLQALRQRIDERFPGSGLGNVAVELLDVARETEDHVAYLRRPHLPSRTLAVVSTALLVALFFVALFALWNTLTGVQTAQLDTSAELLQASEALIQEMVFLGIAIWFFLTLEGRIKRRRALAAIHELRSICHVVDMHQLTKDPERLLTDEELTASSPARNMTRSQLIRYLDFASEMLSLTSKLSALYVQYFNDPVVLETVSEVESLSGGLSNKIWQKIRLLDRIEEPA